MDPDFVRDVPALPPSIAEWEDLLVRLDIAPRAVRVAVDDIAEPGEEVLRVLQLAVARESWYSGVIESLRLGRSFSLNVAFAPITFGDEEAGGEREGTAVELCWAFETQRTRNFAQVQRRGVEVWKWESNVTGGRTLSVFQFLSGVARSDAETLAMIRAAGRGERTA
jgi:hypothetical protein